MTREPAVIVGTITGVAAAVVAAIVAFGIDLSGTQQVAILGVVAALAPIIAAFVTRSKVTPNANVSAVDFGDGVKAGPASPIPDGTPVDVTQGV